MEDALAAADPDRYMSSFFAPADRRRALIALYAFDQEVSRIAAVAREPMAGHIRLAWWREQIGAIYTGARVEAPVPRALAEVRRTHDLPRDLFDRYLGARTLDLEEVPFQDEAALEAHAAAAAGSLMQLAVRVLGGGHRADSAALQAGIACAMAGHLADAGFYAARRRCRAPAAWLEDVRLNAEDFFGTKEISPAVRRLLGRFAARTREALAGLNASQFPTAATPALAVATLARWPLRRGFDPFHARPAPGWWSVSRLSLANLTWRF
jgi:phytoene synthase